MSDEHDVLQWSERDVSRLIHGALEIAEAKPSTKAGVAMIRSNIASSRALGLNVLTSATASKRSSSRTSPGSCKPATTERSKAMTPDQLAAVSGAGGVAFVVLWFAAFALARFAPPERV